MREVRRGRWSFYSLGEGAVRGSSMTPGSMYPHSKTVPGMHVIMVGNVPNPARLEFAGLLLRRLGLSDFVAPLLRPNQPDQRVSEGGKRGLETARGKPGRLEHYRDLGPRVEPGTMPERGEPDAQPGGREYVGEDEISSRREPPPDLPQPHLPISPVVEGDGAHNEVEPPVLERRTLGRSQDESHRSVAEPRLPRRLDHAGFRVDPHHLRAVKTFRRLTQQRSRAAAHIEHAVGMRHDLRCARPKVASCTGPKERGCSQLSS